MANHSDFVQMIILINSQSRDIHPRESRSVPIGADDQKLKNHIRLVRETETNIRRMMRDETGRWPAGLMKILIASALHDTTEGERYGQRQDFGGRVEGGDVEVTLTRIAINNPTYRKINCITNRNYKR
jgi:hypothetical protein